MIRTPALIFAFLLLAGCGTSPPVHYYNLEGVDLDSGNAKAGSPVLAMGPLNLPEYLNRSQMVRRNDGAEIIVDDLNRWAEPLDDGMHRVLSANVDSLLDSIIVVAYPAAALLEVDYRLVGRIDRFDADESGLVVLSVQWGAGDLKGNMIVEPTRRRYTAMAGNPADASAIAKAMNDVLAQFGRDIAAKLGAGIQ